MSISVPPFVTPFIEDENTVRNRLLAAYPDGISQEVGTWARDFGEINVAEFVRQWASIGQMLAQMYISWATGAQLDAWALSYGVDRGLGNPAYGTVRFFAPVGTAIPPAAVVEVPQTDPDAVRLRYQTNNAASLLTTAAGFIDVPVTALDIGEDYNVAAKAITLLDTSLPAVTQVENEYPIVGGEDPEVDEDLRQRVLEQAQLPTGAGQSLDYQVWGGEVPGVGDVAVYTQWDTSGPTPGILDGRQNGSVLMVLRDPFNAPVDFSIVQAVQRHVAPSRALLATFEQVGTPGWSTVTLTGGTTVSLDTANKQIGVGSLQLTFSVGGGTGVVQMSRAVDLSRFAPTDEIIVWIKASDWSHVTGLSLQFLQDAADYFSVPFGTRASDGIAGDHPTSGANWWQWRVQFSQFTKTGNPNWAGITAMQVSAAAAGTTMNFSYMIARYLAGSTGVGGRAPVGADVTAYAPVALPIAVTITNSLLEDGYTLVDTPGQTNAVTLVTAALNDFFAQLQPGMVVRFVDVAKVIHDTPGWIDFTLSLPAAVGTPLAVPVAFTQDPVLGTLTPS